MSCSQLKKQGDLGIGTLEGLDGEMVVVDGQVFHVKDDGKVYPVADEVKTPFASVTHFEADQIQKLTNITSFEHLQQQLDSMITNPNLFYAIRVDGTFKYLKTRSVPKQEKPYPPLVEVTDKQPTFEFEDIQGTLVGFWCPNYVEGINVTGYHLHFINADRQVGGHLLECQLQEGTLEVDQSTGFHLALPEDETFARTDLATDRSEEVERVEK